MNMSEVEMRQIAEMVSALDKAAGKKPASSAGEMNRQQICAALGVSESTIRRLEHAGLPYTPVGARSKRYDLEECKNWLKENNQCPSGMTKKVGSTSASWSMAKEFTESCRKVHLRVMPSS
ncbi:helix-turn-helix transcriptional regulator [Janthinobacterium sp. GB4P2]|uniref:helix-turn-helix transcriptional regulator n=1 Tax=Janthinobacterium sp. GB4P2 TaxID=3424189 RepID=UPI003F273E5B